MRANAELGASGAGEAGRGRAHEVVPPQEGVPSQVGEREMSSRSRVKNVSKKSESATQMSMVPTEDARQAAIGEG